MQITQGTGLPLITSTKDLAETELSKLGLLQFNHDWYGKSPLAETYFLFFADPEKLHFLFSCAQQPVFDQSAKPYEFKEGLWQLDVAEFFLKEDNSDRYQEFNLAPSGAWWSAVFSSYRQQESLCNYSTNDWFINSKIDNNSWLVQCSIKRSALAVNFAGSHTSKANITAIINGEQRQYLSWSTITSSKPDFHKAEDFCRVFPKEL